MQPVCEAVQINPRSGPEMLRSPRAGRRMGLTDGGVWLDWTDRTRKSRSDDTTICRIGMDRLVPWLWGRTVKIALLVLFLRPVGGHAGERRLHRCQTPAEAKSIAWRLNFGRSCQIRHVSYQFIAASEFISPKAL